jgi:hypothetical protein
MDSPEDPAPASELADAYVALIQKQMKHLSEELGEGMSIDAFVPVPGGGQIHVTWFGFHNPDMIKITGLDADGNDVCLLAHKSTLQVILKKVNQVDQKPQVSFQLPSAPRENQDVFDETA